MARTHHHLAVVVVVVTRADNIVWSLTGINMKNLLDPDKISEQCGGEANRPYKPMVKTGKTGKWKKDRKNKKNMEWDRKR